MQKKPREDSMQKERAKATGMEMPSKLLTNTDPNLRTKKNPKIKLSTMVDTQDNTYTTTTEQTKANPKLQDHGEPQP